MLSESKISPLYLWFSASRPKTLIASFAPVVIAFSIAPSFNWTIFFLTLLYALLIQIGTNFSNDYFDFLKKADTSKRKGPIRPLQKGLLSAEAMHRASKWVLALAFILGFSLVLSHTDKGSLRNLFLVCVLLCVACAFLYTAGPISIAYSGLGELFVLLFFGSVATWGTFFLQTKVLSFPAFLLGLSPGALSSAILVANNLRDYEEDKISKKNTLVVRFGKTFGKVEYVFFLLLPPVIPAILILNASMPPKYLLVCLYYLPCFFQLKVFFKEKNYEKALENSAKLLVFFTLLFALIRFL